MGDRSQQGVTLVAGLIILLWPGKSAFFLTAIIAVYAILAGLISFGVAFFAPGRRGWVRAGYIALGVLFIIAGIAAFFNLAPVTAWLAITVAIILGATWIAEGIVALSTAGDSSSRGITIFFSIVSILAGITLILTPLWSAFVLWIFVGASLVAFGILQIVRAITFGRDTRRSAESDADQWTASPVS